MSLGWAAGSPRDRRLAVARFALFITAAGFLFNALRMQAGLDERPLIVSVVAFAALGVGAIGLARWSGVDRVELGVLVPRLLPGAVGAVLAGGVLIAAAALTAPVLHLPNWGQLAQGLVLFGLFVAPAEELLFRGVLYALVERQLGARAAVVISAGSFALVHVPVYGLKVLPLALFAGLLLGWLRWWSRSLGPPTAVHAAADLALLWL